VICSLAFPFAKVRFIRSGFGSLETSDLSQKIAARCASYRSLGCCGCLPHKKTAVLEGLIANLIAHDACDTDRSLCEYQTIDFLRGTDSRW